MSDLNHYRTLIAVADDCPPGAATVPEPGRRGTTIAELQYGMLADSPYRFTQEEVLFPKRYGWGLVFDADGRVALCPRESEQYRSLAGGADPDVKVLKALRSSRG